jgi:hypothetical protein
MGVILTLLLNVATPTDWDVAREALSDMFVEIEGLENVKNAVIYDTRYSSDDAGYLVRTQLAEVLKAKGIDVYFSAPLAQSPEVEVYYLVNELRVVHKKAYRKLLLGKRMIQRWVQADVEVTVIKNNQVLSQQHFVAESPSVFPEADVDLVRCSFTTEYYSSTSAGSLWEPILVTAMVGTLIYLFYAPKE